MHTCKNRLDLHNKKNMIVYRFKTSTIRGEETGITHASKKKTAITFVFVCCGMQEKLWRVKKRSSIHGLRPYNRFISWRSMTSAG